MDTSKVLIVKYHGQKVGKLALYENRYVAFQYDIDWLSKGFSISPYSLPLGKKVFMPKIDPFDGVFGVFADSLPDGWGRLLVDRLFLKKGINPNEVASLDRLAVVGFSGMGALTYEPEMDIEVHENYDMDLDELAAECEKVMSSHEAVHLDDLFRLGGSSGGARPKILTKVDGEDWIIKFPSSLDGKDIGKMEYEYSLCALDCGIEMADTKLFPSKICSGYFGTKRFDRSIGEDGLEKRIHMLSVSGMLETSHRIPNLDYNILMRLTLDLTNDFSQVMKMYRLMCFNVFAHNRDDHSKNFSYLYNENEGAWTLSPAYDLTYSYSIGGEHATCVNGNGNNPGMEDLISVGVKYGIEKKKAEAIANEIFEIVKDSLGVYLGG
jgi:serine/threonine-protein kinase HipA